MSLEYTDKLCCTEKWQQVCPVISVVISGHHMMTYITCHQWQIVSKPSCSSSAYLYIIESTLIPILSNVITNARGFLCNKKKIYSKMQKKIKTTFLNSKILF